MSMGTKIKELRIETRLSQNKLAAKAGLDGGTIISCENGGSPSEMTLAKLISTLSELLGRTVTEEELQ